MIENRYYGDFGGAYIPEILVATFEQLVAAFNDAKSDPDFWEEYESLMSTYSCRPTPSPMPRISQSISGDRASLSKEKT